MTKSTSHTPGPWKVMPCPQHAGKHPLHDHRWVATADTEVEFGGGGTGDWRCESGSLICEMRDGPIANAPLIAAAPNLLEACKLTLNNLVSLYSSEHLVIKTLRAAIAKAEGDK